MSKLVLESLINDGASDITYSGNIYYSIQWGFGGGFKASQSRAEPDKTDMALPYIPPLPEQPYLSCQKALVLSSDAKFLDLVFLTPPSKELATMASPLDLQPQVNRCTETDPRYGTKQLDISSACGAGRRASTLEIGLEDPTHAPPYGDDDAYPEGGLEAWLVVLGAWCAMVPTTGMINTFGVLQAWVAQHELAGYSEPSVGWIFSIHAFVVYFAGAQAGTFV